MTTESIDKNSYTLCSLLISILFISKTEAVKCFECNSANNSACLDVHQPRMHAILRVVDCSASMPHISSKDLFCRKITQTILDPEKTPEVRITRGCGWVKHKRQCYTNDNKDHLETVCQCFGDMCNGGSSDGINVGLAVGAGLLAAAASCRSYA